MPQPRPAAQSFRELQVWRKAHEFVLAIYALTADFPKHETCGLSQQMRRASVSIPANISEGSLEECRYYLILAQDLGYGETTALTALLEQISKMLTAYTNAIRASVS